MEEVSPRHSLCSFGQPLGLVSPGDGLVSPFFIRTVARFRQVEKSLFPSDFAVIRLARFARRGEVAIRQIGV
jgi:hypothetical protein